MKLAIRLLTALVLVELVFAAIFLGSRNRRAVPLLPNEQLADPLIMPDLQRLADQAQRGTPGAWTELGNGLLGKGFYAHAELAFREALRRDQPPLQAQFGLAFSLDRMGRLSESSAEYEKVLQLPATAAGDSLTQSIALYGLGKNALRRENQEEAISLFRKNPNFTAAVYQNAKILLRSDRPSEALPIADEVLEIIPFSLEFHYLRFWALQAMGREREAFKAASMVERSGNLVSLNFNTDYVRPLDQMTGTSRRLGELAKLAGDGDLARFEPQLQEIKSQSGDRPFFALAAIDEQLLRAAVVNRDWPNAWELIASLRQQGFENEWIIEAEGDLWQQQGDTEKAAQAWQRALLLAPKQSLHQKLADHYGDDKAEDRDYHIGQLSLLEGIARYRKNQLSNALDPLTLAAELLPDNPTPLFYIGEMHFHLGNPRQAIQAYQKCLRIRPSHSRAMAKLNHLQTTS
jgi:tetratricopeptide (TPR) repeat protein